MSANKAKRFSTLGTVELDEDTRYNARAEHNWFLLFTECRVIPPCRH